MSEPVTEGQTHYLKNQATHLEQHLHSKSAWRRDGALLRIRAALPAMRALAEGAIREKIRQTDFLNVIASEVRRRSWRNLMNGEPPIAPGALPDTIWAIVLSDQDSHSVVSSIYCGITREDARRSATETFSDRGDPDSDESDADAHHAIRQLLAAGQVDEAFEAFTHWLRDSYAYWEGPVHLGGDLCPELSPTSVKRPGQDTYYERVYTYPVVAINEYGEVIPTFTDESFAIYDYRAPQDEDEEQQIDHWRVIGVRQQLPRIIARCDDEQTAKLIVRSLEGELRDRRNDPVSTPEVVPTTAGETSKTRKVLLVAEVQTSCTNSMGGEQSAEAFVQSRLDAFREAVLPSENYGITLSRATEDDVRDLQPSHIFRMHGDGCSRPAFVRAGADPAHPHLPKLSWLDEQGREQAFATFDWHDDSMQILAYGQHQVEGRDGWVGVKLDEQGNFDRLVTEGVSNMLVAEMDPDGSARVVYNSADSMVQPLEASDAAARAMATWLNMFPNGGPSETVRDHAVGFLTFLHRNFIPYTTSGLALLGPEEDPSLYMLHSVRLPDGTDMYVEAFRVRSNRDNLQVLDLPEDDFDSEIAAKLEGYQTACGTAIQPAGFGSGRYVIGMTAFGN